MSTKIRTTFLTVWLVFMTLAAIFGLLSSIFNLLVDSYASPEVTVNQILPDWYMYLSFILITVQILSVVMMWLWKRLGVYLYFAVGIIGMLSVATLGVLGFISVTLGLLGMGITFLAIKPNWKYFE